MGLGDRPVVVVGAGIGGLVAAALLAARGREVLVIEQAARPGGKIREVTVGGARIGAGSRIARAISSGLEEMQAAGGARVAFDAERRAVGIHAALEGGEGFEHFVRRVLGKSGGEHRAADDVGREVAHREVEREGRAIRRGSVVMR
jgi:phytoene dehydrogenase-like protein